MHCSDFTWATESCHSTASIELYIKFVYELQNFLTTPFFQVTDRVLRRQALTFSVMPIIIVSPFRCNQNLHEGNLCWHFYDTSDAMAFDFETYIRKYAYGLRYGFVVIWYPSRLRYDMDFFALLGFSEHQLLEGQLNGVLTISLVFPHKMLETRRGAEKWWRSCDSNMMVYQCYHNDEVMRIIELVLNSCLT